MSKSLTVFRSFNLFGCSSMQNQNGFALVAVVALALACFGLYTATNKRSCECPAPAIHDDQDPWRNREPMRPSRPRPRRPDGDTGEVKDASGEIVKRDM